MTDNSTVRIDAAPGRGWMPLHMRFDNYPPADIERCSIVPVADVREGDVVFPTTDDNGACAMLVLSVVGRMVTGRFVVRPTPFSGERHGSGTRWESRTAIRIGDAFHVADDTMRAHYGRTSLPVAALANR